MSTIEDLQNRGELQKILVKLERNEFENRFIYARPKFMKWIRNDLPKIVGLDPYNLTPMEQIQDLLRIYITGHPLRIGRQFHRMSPIESDVFELKTLDLRIFGWFYQKDRFIAVNAFDMVKVKQHGLYAAFRDEVIRDRQMLDLDEPKYNAGATEDDVISF